MIDRLRVFLKRVAAPGHAPVAGEQIPLAMAGLLVEAARADHHVSNAEVDALTGLLARRIGLDAEESGRLVQQARAAVENSVSLFEFSLPLQRALSYEEKIEFVRMLWDVVLCDRTLDKYEEYLVGKVAELLYVARGDVIRTRIAAEEAASPGPGA